MFIKYGQIAEGNVVNTKIYRCFDCICEEDQHKFLKKFRDQPHDQEQIMDTFRELNLGAFLASNGLNVRHDYKINGKTPDWCVVDKNLSILVIIELSNHHVDKETQIEIEREIERRQIWFGWPKPNNARLFLRILEKINKYDIIVTEQNVPYVVSVYGDFFAAVSIDEVHQSLFKDHGGLFNGYPVLSGVLFFCDSGGDRYKFKYIPNPKAIRKIDLPSGEF